MKSERRPLISTSEKTFGRAGGGKFEDGCCAASKDYNVAPKLPQSRCIFKSIWAKVHSKSIQVSPQWTQKSANSVLKDDPGRPRVNPNKVPIQRLTALVIALFGFHSCKMMCGDLPLTMFVLPLDSYGFDGPESREERRTALDRCHA